MLSVKNLKVTYGRIAAITDVSFEVPEGKIVTPDRGQRRRQDHHPPGRERPGSARRRHA